ncbi:16732_t:CDS:1, partial [Dentiscutata heterogama]
ATTKCTNIKKILRNCHPTGHFYFKDQNYDCQPTGHNSSKNNQAMTIPDDPLNATVYHTDGMKN